MKFRITQEMIHDQRNIESLVKLYRELQRDTNLCLATYQAGHQTASTWNIPIEDVLPLIEKAFHQGMDDFHNTHGIELDFSLEEA